MGGELFVARSDAAIALQFLEEALDQMALDVEVLVERALHYPVLFRGDDRNAALSFEGVE